MSKPDARVDAYVAGLTRWREETSGLRDILLGCGLDEALKWGKPCYAHRGANVAIIQGFKDLCALLFFKGALLDDPAKLLRAQGKNTQAAMRLEFRGAAEVVSNDRQIRALVAEAVRAEDTGLRPAFPARHSLDYPEELTEALEAEPDLLEAFEALTPGRRRAYVMHFSDAQRPETRLARIARHAERIRRGLGLNDR